jgi:hypothetical protein
MDALRRLNALYLMILSAGLMLSAANIVRADERSESLTHFRELRQQNVKRMQEIDQALRARLELSSTPQTDQTVADLRARRQEHELRQQFLDRMIFQIDTKFRGGDLRQFMQTSLLEMAKNDVALASGPATAANEVGLWRFLKFAADALRRIPEQRENILAFLEGYMNRSVSNPVPPDEYLRSRNYSNGSVGDSGSPIAREDVGALAAERAGGAGDVLSPIQVLKLPTPAQ